MKTFISIAFFLLTAQLIVANDIDKIQTKDHLINFLIEKVDTSFRSEILFDTNVVDNDKYGKGNFFKLDLDANGLTDLLINGQYLFAVIDVGNGKYKINSIDRATFMFYSYTIKDILNSKEQPIIVVGQVDRFSRSKKEQIRTDSLVYKYGDFIEYNQSTIKYSIQKVKFSTTHCFGTCPVFDITINSKRKATYNTKEYNEKKGKFKTVIDSVTFSNLIALLNYIDFPKLNNEFAVDWTDDQTSYLTIYYENGQIKKISDYGLVGTFGLARVYDIFFELCKTANWK